MINRYLSLLAGALILFSCQKDPMEDVNDGNWNKERNIISVAVQNQLGPSFVTRDETSQHVEVYVDTRGLDYASVEMKSLVLSYNATSNVKVGDKLNFNNDTHSTLIVIKAATGGELTWTLTLVPYDGFYLDTWNVKEQRIFVNQEWGSMFDKEMSSVVAKASLENDNLIEWKFEGVRASGKPYGTIVNNAGVDAAYGDYKIDDEVDLNLRVRHLLPVGTSTWEIDMATNEVSIINGATTTIAKVSKQDFGVRLEFTLPYKNPYQPKWNYGNWDNYMCWSYKYYIDLKVAQ